MNKKSNVKVKPTEDKYKEVFKGHVPMFMMIDIKPLGKKK